MVTTLWSSQSPSVAPDLIPTPVAGTPSASKSPHPDRSDPDRAEPGHCRMSRVHRVKRLSLSCLTDPRRLGGGSQRSGGSPRLGAVAVHQPADPGRDVRNSSGNGAARMHVSRFDGLVTVTNVSSTSLWVMVRVGWRKTSTPPCHRRPLGGRGAHARIRTGDLFLTKEMLYRLSYVGGAAASEF